MQIKKEKNKKNIGKSQLIVVGSLLILLGICVIGSKYVYNYFLDKEENSKIKEFYEEQEKIDYLAGWQYYKLFDEKIKGSFHFTPGDSLEESDNGNRSSIHWDIVNIQTPEYGGGEIYFDNVFPPQNLPYS